MLEGGLDRKYINYTWINILTLLLQINQKASNYLKFVNYFLFYAVDDNAQEHKIMKSVSSAPGT